MQVRVVETGEGNGHATKSLSFVSNVHNTLGEDGGKEILRIDLESEQGASLPGVEALENLLNNPFLFRNLSQVELQLLRQ